MAPPEAPSYASAQELVRDVFQVMLPPVRISTAEHAQEHRWLKRPGTGTLKKFDHDDAPFLRGPMDALDDDRFLSVALVGPGQVGKNTVSENWFQKSIAQDSTDFLWYMQTEEAIAA